MRPNRQQTILIFVLVAAATLVAYAPTLGAGFIWDDDAYVENNTTLRTLGGLWRIWFEPTSIPQYYPLVHTTFWIEHQLWGVAPAGYHVTNVLLHLASVWLLFLVVGRLALPGAIAAAAVFALHPVMVESVAWVTERKNVLSMLFYLLAALTYLRWTGLDGSTEGRTRGRWWAAFAFFMLALTSKSVTFSLPFALLLIVYWKRGRIGLADVTPLVPFMVVGIGYGFLTSYLEHTHVGASGREFEDTLIEKCLIAGRTPWFYLGKLLWPAQLVFIYDRWDVEPGELWQWGFPAATLALVGALFMLRGRLGRGPLVTVLLFGGTLFPALGFITVYPFRYSYVADHFQYHASLAIIVGACWLVARFAPRPVAVALLILVPCVYSVRTFVQCQKYADAETLYESILADVPESFFAINNLGAIYVVRGEVEKGLAFYARAKRLNPQLEPGPEVSPEAYAHCMAAKMLGNKHSLGPVVEEFQKARTATDPKVRAAHFQNVARMRAALDPDLHRVLDHFEKAAELHPGYVDALRDAGRMLQVWGMLTQDPKLSTERMLKAVGMFERAVAAEPANSDLRARAHNLHLELANGLGRMGNPAAAAEHRAAARRLRDNDPNLPPRR